MILVAMPAWGTPETIARAVESVLAPRRGLRESV
jgi:hypothetical protein